MFFLNLTAGEFFALFGALSGLITALYLLDRAKRKKIVSTLRFWTSAANAEEKQTRKRMRDPWSLVLQLVSVVLLLLAIAQLQWGSRERLGRDHVLLLDTSAWSAAVQEGKPLMDLEKSLAASYIARTPSRDRIMLVRADALATPATPFTADHAQLKAALDESSPGFSALNINQALSYAKQAESWSGGQPGEIVYVGPKQTNLEETASAGIRNLRVLSVPLMRDNAGIVRMAVKRSDDQANEWQASIAVRNYASQPRTVRLNTRFGATMFAPRILHLSAQQESIAEYVFDTTGSGQLLAQLDPPDALVSDNTAALALPRNGLIRVFAYTARPDALRPLLEANKRLSVKFVSPEQYQPSPPADIVLLDQFSPRSPPASASLWIEPPRERAPLPVKTKVENAVINNWNSATALAAGLREKEAHLAATNVFETFDGDLTIGSVAEGPVIVARPANAGHPKLAVIGFDPLEGEMKYEIATPLLFANLFRWLSPEALRTVDLSAARVGDAAVTLDRDERADQIHVTTTDGENVAFTVHDQILQLFTAHPGIVHVTSYDRERILSLTLPDVAEHEWKLPASAATRLPSTSNLAPGSISLWQWLATLGALGFVCEWMLFAWRGAFRLRRRTRAIRPASRERERELAPR